MHPYQMCLARIGFVFQRLSKFLFTAVSLYSFIKLLFLVAERKKIFATELDYTLCFVYWLGTYLFASNDQNECVSF